MTGENGISNSVMKIALPAHLSSKTVQSIVEIAQDNFAATRKFKLLLDMSQVNQIEQDGLNKLYELTQLMKSNGSPKVVIRNLNRVVRDALILSNTMNLFTISENA